MEYLTAPGAAVSGLRLTTPTSGALTVRFAAGPSSARGTGPRTLSLAVDGGAPQRVTFPYTGSWSSYATVRVPVALPAGPHVLSFRYGTGDSGYVNLDSIAG